MEGDAAFVAGSPTLGAAASAVKRDFAQPFIKEVASEGLVRRIVGFLAMFADARGQALGQHPDDGGRHHIGFNADFHEAHDGLGRRIGVQCGEDQMAGQSCFRGNLCGLKVTDFADEDDIRILTQQGAKDCRKLEVNVRVDLALGDAHQLDLHRVLDGGDIDVGFVDLMDRGVQRGGLAHARRAGHKDDAVRILDKAAEWLQDDLRHHHLVQREHRLAAGGRQDAHDRLFAEKRGDDRNAEVGGAGANRHGEAAVLRETRLRDIDTAEDLDAADQRAMQFARERKRFPQIAIDPIADARVKLVRLDVNVGRPLADGVVDDGIEHLDESLGFREGGELIAREVRPVEEIGAFQQAETALDVLIVRIMDGDRILDFPLGGENRTDRHLGNLAEAFDQRFVLGCRHGHRQRVIDDIEPDGGRFLSNLQGQPLHRLLGDNRGKRIDIGVANGVAPLPARLILADQFAINDGLQ